MTAPVCGRSDYRADSSDAAESNRSTDTIDPKQACSLFAGWQLEGRERIIVDGGMGLLWLPQAGRFRIRLSPWANPRNIRRLGRVSLSVRVPSKVGAATRSRRMPLHEEE